MQQPTGSVSLPQEPDVEKSEVALETNPAVQNNHNTYGHESSGAVPPQMHHHGMNGGIPPPQQVYVNAHMQGMIHPAMTGLENQFQTLGLRQEEGSSSMAPDQLATSAHNSESNIGEQDGEETEDDPVKLFVGQVPKHMNEEEIFPTFNSFGPLKDVAIIRDKHTGLHRGCAFVTYWSATDAERAQEALHDKFTFPGARRPAQVKPAEPSVPENKLFIGMLSRAASEQEVRELFAQYGEIREIYMIRNQDGSSKCAAFLRFVKRESAIQAIENLNGNVMMDGAARPLIVKFADNKHQRQQRQMRSIRKQEMIAAIGVGHAGYPPFHPQVPPPMAMAGHHGPISGPPYSIPPSQYGPAYGPGQHHPPHPYMYPPHQFGPTPPYAYQGQPEIHPPNPRPREGPTGANLFVYHLPHDLSDADLATAFNPFGTVISAKVYVDRYTGESKGFGFVSYDSVMAAESAIENMNGFQIGNKRLKVQHKRVHGSNPNFPPQHLNHSIPPPQMPLQGPANAAPTAGTNGANLSHS